MAMTTSQRRRLLGAICEGLSTESAAEDAGLTLDEVMACYDSEPAFRDALNLASTARDSFREHMERLQEE
jgi:hypothetical protein